MLTRQSQARAILRATAGAKLASMINFWIDYKQNPDKYDESIVNFMIQYYGKDNVGLLDSDYAQFKKDNANAAAEDYKKYRQKQQE